MKPLLLLALLTVSAITYGTPTVAIKNAGKYIGTKVNMCGKITGSKAPASNSARETVLLLHDLGNTASINVVIRNEYRKRFSYKPEEYLYNKNVCFTGMLASENGRAELLIGRPEEIRLSDVTPGADFRPLDFDGFNRFVKDDR